MRRSTALETGPVGSLIDRSCPAAERHGGSEVASQTRPPLPLLPVVSVLRAQQALGGAST